MFGNAQVDILHNAVVLRTSDRSEMQRLVAVHKGQELPADYQFVEADDELLSALVKDKTGQL